MPAARRRRARNQFGGVALATAAMVASQAIQAAKTGAAFAKKHKLLTRATNFVGRVAPKRRAKFRKKHPRIARGLKKLRQRGYGNVGLGRANTKPLLINRQPAGYINYPYMGRPQKVRF